MYNRRAVPRVQAEHLVVEIRHHQAGDAGVVVVRRIHAHARPRFAILAERHAGLDRRPLRNVPSRSCCDTACLAPCRWPRTGRSSRPGRSPAWRRRAISNCCRKCRFCAVTSSNVPFPAIVEQPASRAAICLRSAVGFLFSIHAAKYVLRRRPFHVIANEQIQQPVTIDNRTTVPSC